MRINATAIRAHRINIVARHTHAARYLQPLALRLCKHIGRGIVNSAAPILSHRLFARPQPCELQGPTGRIAHSLRLGRVETPLQYGFAHPAVGSLDVASHIAVSNNAHCAQTAMTKTEMNVGAVGKHGFSMLAEQYTRTRSQTIFLAQRPQQQQKRFHAKHTALERLYGKHPVAPEPWQQSHVRLKFPGRHTLGIFKKQHTHECKNKRFFRHRNTTRHRMAKQVIAAANSAKRLLSIQRPDLQQLAHTSSCFRILL